MRTLTSALFIFFAISVAASDEVVLQTAPVPNRFLRQGDAVYFVKGETVGIRITLKTRHLDHIEKKILEAENTNWPDHPDSARYCTALSAACEQARDSGSGRIPFTIEWRLEPDETGVVKLVWSQGSTLLAGLGAEYLKGNFELILKDRFGTTGERETE